jgi:outer membrane protein assembly factor BamB
VHIITYCPSCRNRYQLQPDLVGSKIRCPNPVCREVFEVRADGANGEPENGAGGPPPATPGTSLADSAAPSRSAEDSRLAQPESGADSNKTPPISGSVGDLVPMLEGEAADDTADQAPSAIRWQNEPPPVRRGPASAAPPIPGGPGTTETPKPRSKAAPSTKAPARRGEQSPADQSGPPRIEDLAPSRAVAPSPWETPPPVRAAGGDAIPPDSRSDGSVSPSPLAPPSAAAKRRRSLGMAIALGILAAAVVTTAGVLAWSALRETEENLFQAGKSLYDEGKFAQASAKFERLVQDYPDSPRYDEYNLLAALSRARDDAEKNPNISPEAALRGLEYFASHYDQNSAFEAYRSDFTHALEVVTENLATSASVLLEPLRGIETLKDRVARATDLLGKAEQAQALAKKYYPKGGLSPRKAGGEGNGQALANYPNGGGPDSRVAELVASVRPRIALAQKRLDAFALLNTFKPTGLNIRRAKDLISREGLQDEPPALDVLGRLREQFFATLTYTDKDAVAPEKPTSLASTSRLMIVPPVAVSGQLPQANAEVVFALARGMLYALAGNDGSLLWAAHIGIDASTLPLRVPDQEGARDIVLVMSSDKDELTARDVKEGRELWHQKLNSPCVARPFLIGYRVYVPTYAGDLHEINANTGSLEGTFHLGMPLTVGGSHQEGTDLIYLPADSLYVYVLDVAQHKCVGILETDHPSGSIRNEPLIIKPVNASGDTGADVSQAKGYLVLSQTDGLEFMKLRAFLLPIVNWVESVAVEPQIRMPGWSWFPPHYDGEKISQVTDRGSIRVVGVNQANDQDSPLFVQASEDSTAQGAVGSAGRAEMVHADEHNLWVLTAGELQRLLLTIDDGSGLHLAKIWRQPVPLGAPLHEAQVSKARDTLYVVTQSSTRRDCLATAVASGTGEIRWQRMLGLICRGDPLVLGGQVVAVDQGGGLYLFDPAAQRKRRTPADAEWQIGGEVVAPSLQRIVVGPFLFPGPDGVSALEIACVEKDRPAADGSSYELILRRFDPGKEVQTQSFPLSERLAGMPGVAADHLVLPLADGRFVRQFFLGPLESGLFWRNGETDPNSHGHVAVLGPQEFLITDGFRGLSRWQWPAGGPKLEKSFELGTGAGAIVGAPLVVRKSDQSNGTLVCVADSKGSVFLIRANDLTIVRRWELKGPIATAPFLLGDHIGCVVDGRRFVWLNPDRDQPSWQYETPYAGIVGQPHLSKGLVVVADLAGRLVGLDPATGRPAGREYRMGKGAIPAAAPVPFGAEQLFVPVTDGSVLLPPIEQLRSKAATASKP